MKKLLLVLAIGTFVACNDSGSAEEPTADTPATEAPAPPVADSPAVSTDSSATAPDSTLQK